VSAESRPPWHSVPAARLDAIAASWESSSVGWADKAEVSGDDEALFARREEASRVYWRCAGIIRGLIAETKPGTRSAT
jgi:hypothetical protein